jgi:hypothetical protein
MNTSLLSKLMIGALCLSAFASARAADAPSSQSVHTAPTKQEREKMATLHEHMAACLRSDKSLRECHEAARKECEDAMGEKCQMMHSMMEHRMNKQRENGDSQPHQHQ